MWETEISQKIGNTFFSPYYRLGGTRNLQEAAGVLLAVRGCWKATQQCVISGRGCTWVSTLNVGQAMCFKSKKHKTIK